MSHNNRRNFLRSGMAAGACLGLASKSRANGKPRRPNIVYVLTDQWRAQATGYAGDPNVKTPRLDELAERSINFENAVSVCPVCTPHRASLLTGRYPLSTGMFMNDLALPPEELCMGDIFKEAGYDTGYIGKWHVDGHGRYAFIPKERRQGFDYWKVLECTHRYNESPYYANDERKRRIWDGYDAYAQTKDAQAYIKAHAAGDKPFILVMAYGGPHFPHETAPQDMQAMYPPESIQLRPNVPEEFHESARKEAQGYYGHCSALDKCVGDLQETLKEAGILENTIFVFTSDHGEMLGSQGQKPKQKQRPWDESICVPFLISYPAISGQEKRTVKSPINTPDILPTLLSLSGVAIPDTIEGEDLSRLIINKIDNEDRAALIMSVHPFAGYYDGHAFRGIRTMRYTYVRNLEGPWLLYDNEKDPHQMNNLVGNPDIAAMQEKLEKQLQEKLTATNDQFLPREDYLKSWGYSLEGGKCIPFQVNSPVQSPANRPKA